MRPNVAPVVRTDELNGLNWQVHVVPVTLSITTLPPTLPAFAAVGAVADVVADVVPDVVPDAVADELLDELPPHAVTRMHRAASAATQWKRFIETLSSPYSCALGLRAPGGSATFPT